MTTGVRSLAYPSSMQVEPDAIFRIYADVEQWPAWDPDTKQASLQGPFQVGSRGRLTPAKGSTMPMLLTEVAHSVTFSGFRFAANVGRRWTPTLGLLARARQRLHRRSA